MSHEPCGESHKQFVSVRTKPPALLRPDNHVRRHKAHSTGGYTTQVIFQVLEKREKPRENAFKHCKMSHATNNSGESGTGDADLGGTSSADIINIKIIIHERVYADL